MSRNSPDFLSAYLTYARDGFCPDPFHFWTGVSIVAGALERKVWINQKGRLTFPNLYTFLIAHPGEGKSTASDLGVNDFLREIKTPDGRDAISLLPAQMTDAFFASKMAHRSRFEVGSEEYIQCAHFFYVSEAENSLKELAGGGELTAALTDFYDCPRVWKKGTVGKGEVTAENLCCNALVGCTFSYLNRLFPDERIMGGFASRILYIVAKELKTRNVKWEPDQRNSVSKNGLLADLNSIYNLKGQFRVTREYGQAFEEWFPRHDAHRRALKNERMQAFSARKHTNLLKLSMVCSAAESDSLILDKSHWDRSLELLEETEGALGLILQSAADPASHLGTTQIITSLLRAGGYRLHANIVYRSCLAVGISKDRMDAALTHMVSSNLLRVDGMEFVLHPDADNHF